MFDDKENFMFDLYGTLVDIKTDESFPFLWSSLANYFSMRGASYNDTDLRAEYARLCEKERLELLSDLRLRHSAYKITENDVEIDLTRVFAGLYELKGVQPSKRLVADTAIMMRSVSTVKLRLYDGAVKIPEELRRRGKRVYLLSNAQACFTVPELKSLGLYDLFDGIFISSELKVKKPSLAFYRKALEGMDPKSCVMFGNDEFADIRGAMGAGMEACYIQTEQSPSIPVILPSKRIQSLWEIID